MSRSRALHFSFIIAKTGCALRVSKYSMLAHFLQAIVEVGFKYRHLLKKCVLECRHVEDSCNIVLWMELIPNTLVITYCSMTSLGMFYHFRSLANTVCNGHIMSPECLLSSTCPVHYTKLVPGSLVPSCV